MWTREGDESEGAVNRECFLIMMKNSKSRKL